MNDRKRLPENSGVYLFLDAKGSVIYVGKAKNLKKRVASYFNKNVRGKTRVLTSKVARIEHIVVETESDALLLENNLIKEHQPRYNILLKDDKTFPWICIKNERFPRVFLTRNIVQDGSEYLGPYTSVVMVRTLLDLIRKLYPIRTCKHNLSEQNVTAGKFKPCLEYHIGHCHAPCIGKQTEEEYNAYIEDVRKILKGNLREVLSKLKTEMRNLASRMEFERAQMVKEKLELIENYRSKTVIVNPSLNDIDVFSYTEHKNMAAVNFLHISKGAVVQSHTVEVKRVLEEPEEEVLAYAVRRLRDRFHTTAKMCILPFPLKEELPGVRFVVPVRGDKKKLIELSERNARIFLLEKEKRRESRERQNRDTEKLSQLMKDLRMKELPRIIEGFDNSNIQGTNPVAACVVFHDGKPAKKEYRHFHIRNVRGPDDFASMKEVVFRRYSRLIREGRPLPQLIVIDGGRGQLSAALESLTELGINNQVAVIGIAKKLEEIYFPHDQVPLYLDKTGTSLRILRHIRDEAHRFGITFHRNRRSATQIESELGNIRGLGDKSVHTLLRHFKSMDTIKNAGIAELEEVIGKRRAAILKKYFEDRKE